jgi:hypothetical protein
MCDLIYRKRRCGRWGRSRVRMRVLRGRRRGCPRAWALWGVCVVRRPDRDCLCRAAGRRVRGRRYGDGVGNGTTPRDHGASWAKGGRRRRLSRRRRPLDGVPHRRRGGLAARESRFSLAGAAPANVHKRMRAFGTGRAYNVVVNGTVVAERFPVPLASSSSRAQATHTPACANALDGRSWVIFFLEQKPVCVYPFEQPINSDKVSFLHDDSVHFAFPVWHRLCKRGRKHGSKIL